MAMKDVNLTLSANTVQITASFDDMSETVRFGEAAARLVRVAAVGAPEEVQQAAGWIASTTFPEHRSLPRRLAKALRGGQLNDAVSQSN
jgi:hypothetical protein